MLVMALTNKRQSRIDATLAELMASAAVITGAGTVTAAQGGYLQADASIIEGVGTAQDAAVGSLEAGASQIDGVGTSRSTGSGSLEAGAAQVDGTGTVSGVVTSYSNPLGSGNRTATIAITTNITLGGAGTMNNLVDGAFGANLNDAIWWPGGQGANRFITFDFGSAKVVNEAKIYASTTTSMGTWKWRGSNTNNGVDWVDLSANFTWAGSTGGAVNGNMAANVTAYRYLQCFGNPGTISATPWNEEFEFKIEA